MSHNATAKKYENVPAQPVKSFFVSMFTRDIKLEDAILDLLDNCVDGILRQSNQQSGAQPYTGFYAKIEFDKNTFSITDNCGGIPWRLHEYAFRMGRSRDRPDDAPGTVGVYGIGMKRAIFKMGKQCLISTQSGTDAYELEITPAWIQNEDLWEIPVREADKSMKEDGTTLVIGSLHESIKRRFSIEADDFESTLRNMVATHYAFIIQKGLQVDINNKTVKPRPTELIFSKKIKPFIFQAEIDGVEIFLAVGFTRPLPTADEVEDAQHENKYSSLSAGWTVLCNDRAVLYCDRSELTGWGEAGVPRYHTQFIAISGVVEFRSSDAEKLPTTTTKRGIDATSPLYLQVKNKMREGMKIFIDYTNKWRGRVDEAKKHIQDEVPLSLPEIRERSQTLQLRTTRSYPPGQQFRPNLPKPRQLPKRQRRINFIKPIAEVEAVTLHLYDNKDVSPSEVGEKCFDLIYQESRQ